MPDKQMNIHLRMVPKPVLISYALSVIHIWPSVTIHAKRTTP